MNLVRRTQYTKNEATTWAVPNYWDFLALLLLLAIIALLGWDAKLMMGKFQLGESIPISLNPTMLPYYASRTVMRMFIAMGCSLLFTFIFGTWAAKSKHAEVVIIPAIDILQSVPILGFLAITITGFIRLFPNSMLGPECAAIFAIFVAQVWNMTLSFYQSVRGVPKELKEASRAFHLSSWQQFWKIDVPFAMPSLIWSMMMSMSGSWVFLVAAEAITVANQNITLPGIGSYIALAIEQTNLAAIRYAIVAMLIVIALYDQLLFRPLMAWSEKFKMEEDVGKTELKSWVLHLFQLTRLFPMLWYLIALARDKIINFKFFRVKNIERTPHKLSVRWQKIGLIAWYAILSLIVTTAILTLIYFIFSKLQRHEVLYVFYLGFITAIRVMVSIIISALIWVPLGVWIGLNPRATQIVQPIAQFFAAFPANLLFPFFVVTIVTYKLNVDIGVTPLMIIGTQWYILFNVIAGTMVLPKQLHHAVGMFNVKGWLWWKRFILPGIFPYFITGAITAAGGAWNLSIIAEAVSWGHTELHATGLGNYITEVSVHGDFPRLALGIAIMSIYVLVLNRLVWRPLYNVATERFQIK